MKPPTYNELLQIEGSLRLACSTALLTARDRAILHALTKTELANRYKACRFTLGVPGVKPGPWYYRTKAEGEAHRRWLIRNIDLTPKARVVPYTP